MAPRTSIDIWLATEKPVASGIQRTYRAFCPDRNNVEAVYHGPARRFVEDAVVISGVSA